MVPIINKRLTSVSLISEVNAWKSYIMYQGFVKSKCSKNFEVASEILGLHEYPIHPGLEKLFWYFSNFPYFIA